MVDDPYKVLEIPRDASKEDIKRAYRKMGKKYHPDLHPNDPEAEKKMREINEAYDMLNNPEKYEQRRTQARSEQSYGGNPYQNPYGNSGQQSQGGYYGGNGWYGEFDFEDLFGFSGRRSSGERVQAQPGDSQDIRQAIDFIYMRKYSYAQQTLNSIVSAGRDARWYYLSAVTSDGLGNTYAVLDQINKAIQMDPGNAEYVRFKQRMQSGATNYRQSGYEQPNYAKHMWGFCLEFWLLQMFCMFCRC